MTFHVRILWFSTVQPLPWKKSVLTSGWHTGLKVPYIFVPLGIPFVYELDPASMKPVVSMKFLGDEETVKKAIESVANQGKAKKSSEQSAPAEPEPTKEKSEAAPVAEQPEEVVEPTPPAESSQQPAEPEGEKSTESEVAPSSEVTPSPAQPDAAEQTPTAGETQPEETAKLETAMVGEDK